LIAVAAILAVTGATVGLGLYGVRLARTTSDLFVASRAITPWWNAAAISGEYLSAASFLGIAGLQMKLGSGALWLPLGFTAGYLALLLFVAAPLRRFGAYTISDFAEARLRSPRIRVLAAVVVLGIAGFYLVPQLKGAGLTLGEVTGAPYWVGVVAVGVVVALNVASGGMRGITYVQAFQYWLKTFAIALPACLLLMHLGGLPERAAMFGQELPRAGDAGLVVQLDEPQAVTFPEATTYTVDGVPAEAAEGEELTLPAGEIGLPPDAVVPVADGIEAQSGEDWARPVESGGPTSPVFVYSLLLATFLGTMGLPHILVRFYTNPDGPAARRTTVRVLGLLAIFYAFPLVYGALGRVLVPELYLTGDTDSVVLRLPEAAWPGLPGELLGALVAAGAFAAFLSTVGGLLVLVAGALSQDVLGSTTVGGFRRAAAIGGAVALLLGLAVEPFDINRLVGWAFAIAASSFCPLLVLGIWWRGLSARGALAGLLAGGGAASAAILSTMLGFAPGGWAGSLLGQPAAWTVPLAFAVMVLVSRRTPASVPPDVGRTMVALHTPERLGLTRTITR
jgi:cation/acetate symporter